MKLAAEYSQSQRYCVAVAKVDFELYAGKTLAVVGESGCGKSTLARMVTMIEEPTAGTLTLDGKEVVREGWAALRSSVQIVFPGSLRLA